MIRPAAGADLAALGLLWERYRVEAGDTRFVDQAGWGSWVLPRISAGDVRVGTTDRTVNSYVAWQRATIADPGEGRVLRILELYVHPDGRGQRLGSGLLARAIDAARQRECRAVVLASNISEAYWPWPNRSGSCFRGTHCSSHSNASSGQTGGVGGAGSGTGTGTGRSVVHVSHAGFVPAVGATNGLAVGASRMPP